MRRRAVHGLPHEVVERVVRGVGARARVVRLLAPARWAALTIAVLLLLLPGALSRDAQRCW